MPSTVIPASAPMTPLTQRLPSESKPMKKMWCLEDLGTGSMVESGKEWLTIANPLKYHLLFGQQLQLCIRFGQGVESHTHLSREFAVPAGQ